MQLLEIETGGGGEVIVETPLPHPHQEARDRVRQQIAELTVDRDRMIEIRQAIANVEAGVDGAEGFHAEAVAPIQAEMATIRGEAVDAQIVGGKLPADREARRQELLKLLEAENSKLQTAARDGEDKLKMLREEHAAVEKRYIGIGQFNETTLTNDLAGSLARPEQRLQQYVNLRTIDWTQARLKASRTACEDVELMLKRLPVGQSGREELTRRLERFKAEASEAGRLASAAQSEADRYRREVIAE